MQRIMLTLDRRLARHRRLVLGLWLIALVAAAPFALHQSAHLTGGGFTAPGSASDRVYSAVSRDFPGASAEPLAVVLVPGPGSSERQLLAATRYVEREVSDVHDVSVGPVQSGARDISASGEAAGRRPQPLLLPLSIRGGEQADIDIATKLRRRFGITTDGPGRGPGGYRIGLVGQGALWAAFQDDAKRSTETGEARGFPVISLVLLAVFGSLAAVALPLGLGVVAVTITGALIYAVSLTLHMSIFVTNMASMLGLGVAVDYSLFILARYREEIAAGARPDEARATALATSGGAVIFSGLTVIASLAGLFLTDSAALRSMAIGAIIVVAVSMLAAATLLPVLIGLLGRRVDQPNGAFRRLWSRRRQADRPAFWERWSTAVMRRPIVSVLVALAVMLALAAPALQLKMGNDALSQLPANDSAVATAHQAAAMTGPGAAGPIDVVITLPPSHNADAAAGLLRRLTTAIAADPEVALLARARPSREGRSLLVPVLLRVSPDSDRARAALARLRARLPGVAGSQARIEVGGTTATLVDFDRLIARSLVKIMVFVLALSFVVLLVLLRSVILPLKAVLMNVLSVGAAYGATVAVFQWGWLSFLGLRRTPYIDTITPPLVLAVAFGLSMDYEVFLLTRIRERYLATGDNRSAVAQGLSTSARTITSAALIMVAVFLAFLSAGLPSVQRLGFACAVAIALDATIVRLVLVPAAMELLGKWNWWLPSALTCVLPSVELEHCPSALIRATGESWRHSRPGDGPEAAHAR